MGCFFARVCLILIYTTFVSKCEGWSIRSPCFPKRTFPMLFKPTLKSNFDVSHFVGQSSNQLTALVNISPTALVEVIDEHRKQLDPINSTHSSLKNEKNIAVKRWRTGLLLGSICAFWVCCPTTYFSLGFLAIAYLAHNEFVKMMHAIDIKPAIVTSRLLTALFFASAMWAPYTTTMLLTFSILALFFAHLTSQSRKPQAIDIFASIFGVIYLGYFPSFWIALHGVSLPSYAFQLGKYLTVWSWIIIISTDAGGYFIGRAFGRHKLSTLSYAAGVVSPNKTIEGLLGGLFFSWFAGLTGAYLLGLPSWLGFGTIFGTTLAISSILGDLLASALKRSANCKDSGTLLPGHGGILDRFDSHIISGAVAVHLLHTMGVLPV